LLQIVRIIELKDIVCKGNNRGNSWYSSRNVYSPL